MKTFARGIHPPEHKELTAEKPIEKVPQPKRVILPLNQNLGCACEPLVQVGEEVAASQKIADSSKFISAPIHAPISGKVISTVPAIIIECPITNVQLPIKKLGINKSLNDLDLSEIRRIVRDAGIVGLGGAAFPTHVKLTPPQGKKIETIIINGCECEPYITTDHRLMLERPEEIIFGAQAIAKAVGAERIIIAIENNKENAIQKLKSEILNPESETNQNIEIQRLETKYPQGGEKMLIKALLGREVPSGGLPLDIGVVVNNVNTAVAIAEAIKLGRPLIERVITVTGSGVREPKNLLARIGTPFQELVDFCGGLMPDAAKVIMGGPMTGITVSSLDAPLLKANNCLLVLNKEEAKIFEEQSCIRCGRCIKACPVGLMPNFLADFTKIKNWEKAEDYHAADCIECGSCAYVCPSRIYLVQYFKVAKKEVQKRKTVCQ